MGVYDKDGRVSVFGERGFTATRDDGAEFRVLHTDVFAWTICHGPNLDFVMADDGPAIGYVTEDDALFVVLGDPR